MTPMFPQIDFGPGTISPIDSCYDPTQPQESQIDILREDMFQVSYATGHTIDVGWYPSFQTSGTFRVYLIHNDDWEQPLRDIKVKKYKDLVAVVSQLVRMVRQISD